MAYFLQQLLNAVPVAALYAVLAFGYAIAFSVTKRADVTYGAIFAFAGQTCLLLLTSAGTGCGWFCRQHWRWGQGPACSAGFGPRVSSVGRSCGRWQRPLPTR